MDLWATTKAGSERVTSRLAHAAMRLGARARAKLRALAGPPAPMDLSGVQPAPVVVYFTGGPHVRYQLVQWLPVLERLHERHHVVVVGRSSDDVDGLRTGLPVVVAPALGDLYALYTHLDVKVVLYPNNALGNFQSLVYRRALHVHVNHGESDKISMVSNQAKAYDRVVVAGQAAVERHARALIEFDGASLTVCGRPQLDIERTAELERAVDGGRTVLYAPTWSGEDDSNNYTSVDVYGVAIVRAALAGGLRVVYKPHPRVPTTQVPAVESAHLAIVAAIADARREAPERDHRVLLDADVLATFDAVDLLVTDVSSVGLDFLYLRPDAPIVLTDRRSRRAELVEAAPIARVAHVVDAETVETVRQILEEALTHDPHAAGREAARAHYFGPERGESIVKFCELVSRTIQDRDVALANLPDAPA